MNRYHEVNELYDGTLNSVHHYMYTTDIAANDSFTFRNAMKQEDKMSFVAAMEKEIADHEAGNHWSVVHRDTLPNRARPIKAIWSFKGNENQMARCLNKKHACAPMAACKNGALVTGRHTLPF